MSDMENLSPADRQDGVKHRLLQAVTLVALPVGVALALYSPAFRFGFNFDDMVHFFWLDWRTLWTVWLSAKGLTYYRPLPFSTWKVVTHILGRHDPQVIHAINIILHGLNAGLVSQLAWRLKEGRARFFFALSAGVLFATFPFAFQAIANVSSLCHPLATAIILSSVLFYWDAHRGQNRRRNLITAFLLATIAPFAHESGVILGLFLLLVELFWRAKGTTSRVSRWPLAFLAVGSAGALIWMAVPKESQVRLLVNPASLWHNTAYFLQALAYPLSPLGASIAIHLPTDEFLLVAGFSSLVLLAAYLGTRSTRVDNLFLFGLVWFALALLPAWALLPFEYVVDGPRLLYLASVGAALLWATVVPGLALSQKYRAWIACLGIGLVALLGWQGIGFARDKVQQHALLSNYVDKAVDVAAGHSRDEPLLFVNVPAWLASRTSRFLLGHEGVTLIPEYSTIGDLIYWNGNRLSRQIDGVTLVEAFDESPFYHGFYGPEVNCVEMDRAIRAHARVYLTTWDGSQLHIRDAGGLLPQPPDRLTATLDHSVSLAAGELRLVGDFLQIELRWAYSQPLEVDATVFLHLVDDAGRIVAQDDRYPLQGLWPLRYWQAGDAVADLRWVRLPRGLPVGSYTVLVGVYDRATGKRLTALDPRGQPFSDDAVPVGYIRMR
jgi:hypothetical protein